MKSSKKLREFVTTGPVAMVFSVTMAVLLVTGLIEAATTISTNITTDGKITGNYASSTVLSVNNTAFFGGTATTTINGAGNLFVVGSTTLQSFTATFGTTTAATSTNLYATNFLANGSSTLQAFTATEGTVTSATSTNLRTTNFLVNGSSTLQNFTFQNATSTTSNTATSTLSVGCIQMYATSTATAVRLEIGAAAIATASSTSFRTGADLSEGMVLWAYGTCP